MQKVSLIEHTDKLICASESYGNSEWKYLMALNKLSPRQGAGVGIINLKIKLIFVIYMQLMECSVADINTFLVECITKLSDNIGSIEKVRSQWNQYYDEFGLEVSLLRRSFLMSLFFEERPTYYDMTTVESKYSSMEIFEMLSGVVEDEEEWGAEYDPYGTLIEMENHIDAGNNLQSFIEAMTFPEEIYDKTNPVSSLYGELLLYFPNSNPEDRLELRTRDRMILNSMYMLLNYSEWDSTVAEAFIIRCSALDEYCRYREENQDEIKSVFLNEDLQIQRIVQALEGCSELSDLNDDVFCFTRIGKEYICYFSYLYIEEDNDCSLFRCMNPLIGLLLRELEKYLDSAKERLHLKYKKKTSEWRYNSYIAAMKKEDNLNDI